MNKYKSGFDYYNVDTDRYLDEKIRRLKRKYKCEGIAVYDYILSEIYRDKGYFVELTSQLLFDISEYFNIGENLVDDIVYFCQYLNLFDPDIYENYKILTSKSIQERYLSMSKSCRRQNVEIKSEFNLLEEVAEELPEKKEKDPRLIIPPTIEMVQSYCKERKNNVDPLKWFDFYTSKGWMIGKQKMKDWQAAVRTWERNDRQALKPKYIDDYGERYFLDEDNGNYYNKQGKLYR